MHKRMLNNLALCRWWHVEWRYVGFSCACSLVDGAYVLCLLAEGVRASGAEGGERKMTYVARWRRHA
jgi:hypothetical protein